MSDLHNEKKYFLSFDRVSKTSDDKKILEDVSFDIEKKGVHGILAPKGSGKTTLLDVIACMVDVDCGSVTLGEEIISGKAKSKDIKEIKKRIGYVRSNLEFYRDMTVTEVLSFVGEARKVKSEKLTRQIKEALELTELYELRKRKTKLLSFGEQKRLGIATALLGNPDIILIDEPDVSDMGYKRVDEELFELIKILGKPKTVIVTTENYKIAKMLCDDVVILSDGKVLACGNFAELEERLEGKTSLEELYNSLLGSAKSGKKVLNGGDNE